MTTELAECSARLQQLLVEKTKKTAERFRLIEFSLKTNSDRIQSVGSSAWFLRVSCFVFGPPIT